MARIRTVKPEIWTSEQFVECSTSARLLFIGIWNFCDDAGVHVASVKRLKMEVFPADQCSPDEVRQWIDELICQGLLIEYVVDGKRYWNVTGWHHQKIERPTFKYPSPDQADEIVDYSTSGRRVVDDASPPEWSLRESKGKEVNICGEVSPRSSGKPDEGSPREELPEYPSEFEEFWTAYPKRGGRKRGKQGTFELWKKLPAKDRPEVVKAARNYASEEFIKDPERFLKKSYWRDFLEPADTSSGRPTAPTDEDLANYSPGA